MDQLEDRLRIVDMEIESMSNIAERSDVAFNVYRTLLAERSYLRQELGYEN